VENGAHAVTSSIPNVCHFVFGLREQTEPFHLMHYICLKSCLEVMQPDAIRFHYKNEPFGPLWQAIRPHLELVPIKPMTPANDYAYGDRSIEGFRYAHVSDFVRLEILLSEGGIYADMDTLFLRRLPAAMLSHECFMGHEKAHEADSGEGSLCNAVIGAARGSRFCQLWLDAMEGEFDGTWSNHSTLLPYRLALEHPALIHVEPRTSFFGIDWTPQGIAELFERRRTLGDESFSLHLWSHLWFDPLRRDFSLFNGQLLTEDYVAFGATTYAENARRFLPAAAGPSYPRYLKQLAGLSWRQFLHQAKMAIRTIIARRPADGLDS
jgi:hypothetical protein